MTTAEFRLPDLGEGLTSAELVSWHVDVGEHVSIDQVIADVETAKAQVELPSPYTGVVAELLAEPGATVPVGAPIIRIESTDPVGASASAPPVLVGYGPQTAHASRRRRKASPESAQHKQMARAMTASARAPQATVFVTIDVTASMELLGTLRNCADFENCSVTPLTLAAKSLVTAIASHPGVNATWDETAERSVVHPHVNLGIAVASDSGLVVPNIKDAGSLTLREIALRITELTSTARAGRTDVAHLTGGTITITNIGVFGMDAGTPIINPGEAGIVAMGTISQKPWVVDGEVRPRWVTTVAGSFDHRVVDGDAMSRFVADVASVLEEPALLVD